MKSFVTLATGLMVALLMAAGPVLAEEKPASETIPGVPPIEELKAKAAEYPSTASLIELGQDFGMQMNRAANRMMRQVRRHVKLAEEILAGEEISAADRAKARSELRSAAQALSQYKSFCPPIGLHASLKRAAGALKKKESEEAKAQLSSAKHTTAIMKQSDDLKSIVTSIDEAIAAIEADNSGKASSAVAAALGQAAALAGPRLDALATLAKRIRQARKEIAEASGPALPTVAQLLADVDGTMRTSRLQEVRMYLSAAIKKAQAKDLGSFLYCVSLAEMSLDQAGEFGDKAFKAKLAGVSEALRKLSASTTPDNLGAQAGKVKAIRKDVAALSPAAK